MPTRWPDAAAAAVPRSDMPSSPAAQINTLVSRFVAGQPFREFHRDFMTFVEHFDDGVLPDAQRDAYWGVFDLVYLGRPDPVAPASDSSGAAGALTGESALRERLRHFRLVERGGAIT